MKYKVTIEGGFMGIPKAYEGVLELEGEKEKKLLSYLEATPPVKNDLLRDGRLYHIRLETPSRVCQSVLDDSNLPVELRNFIDRIQSL